MPITIECWTVVERADDTAPPKVVAVFEEEEAARRLVETLARDGRRAEIERTEFAGCGCGA